MRVNSCISDRDGFGGQFSANLAEMRGEQQQRGQLRGEGFCRRDADFWTGVRQNRAGRFARDHRAHHVADGERRRAFEFGFALAGERVGGFAGLADADCQRLRVENRIAIAELAAVVDFDRQCAPGARS